MTDPTCESCGVPYAEHLGLVGTCQRVQALEAQLTHIEEYTRDWPTATRICRDCSHPYNGPTDVFICKPCHQARQAVWRAQ